MGMLALAGLLQDEGALNAAERSINPLLAKQPHFPAKAKNVIWIFVNGGPSQVDTWDYKPELIKRDGKKLHLSAPKQMASITYGVWNDRSKDVTHRVELPYTIDPEADGLNIDDGSYLVIKVKFEQIPSSPTAVTAETRQ